MSFDVEKMLRGILDSGWDGIEQAGKAGQAAFKDEQERRERQAAAEAAIMARAFETGDGRAALELLIRKTLLRSPAQEEREATTVERYALLKAQRAGQNDIVFMILNMLRRAGGEAPQHGGEQ